MAKRKPKRCSFRGTLDVRTPTGLARMGYRFGRACIPKSKRCRQPVPKATDVAACNTIERFGMHEADARELRKLMGQDASLPSRARRGMFGARRG